MVDVGHAVFDLFEYLGQLGNGCIRNAVMHLLHDLARGIGIAELVVACSPERYQGAIGEFDLFAVTFNGGQLRYLAAVDAALFEIGRFSLAHALFVDLYLLVLVVENDKAEILFFLAVFENVAEQIDYRLRKTLKETLYRAPDVTATADYEKCADKHEHDKEEKEEYPCSSARAVRNVDNLCKEVLR